VGGPVNDAAVDEAVIAWSPRTLRSIVLVVPREAAGVRLDRFLASALATLEGAPSRSELQRWIERGRVTVGGATKRAADKLREGAEVTVQPEPPPPTEAIAEAGVRFDVLHADDALLVLVKPAGLVVHPAKGHARGTLVNGLLGMGVFDRALREGQTEAERDRPGIVHRLDKGTSGVMVVARTERAREHLKAQFAAHTIEREYEALCAGDVRPGTIATLYGRHATDRKRFTSKIARGKRAVTHVRVMERFGSLSKGGILATHVACTLETGRTHQIRVHLSESRSPILGDPLYGKPSKLLALRQIAEHLGHQALHARLLGFEHPTTGERVRFEAPPPADFTVALEALRAFPV
jgi:23S rRNA pseudouridine1911/1915/1917 synthase